MLFRLQRPVTWLWEALGILTGTNPSNISSDMVPVVDAMQNGLGSATYLDSEFVGAVGAPVVSSLFVAQTFPKSDRFAYLLRFDVSNPGTANVNVGVRVYRNSSFKVRTYGFAVGAGQTFGWDAIGRGAQWIFIPPDYDCEFDLGAYTTTAGRALFTLVQVPAGTKPW